MDGWVTHSKPLRARRVLSSWLTLHISWNPSRKQSFVWNPLYKSGQKDLFRRKLWQGLERGLPWGGTGLFDHTEETGRTQQGGLLLTQAQSPHFLVGSAHHILTGTRELRGCPG